jgi:CheY-like chemotaxis protein
MKDTRNCGSILIVEDNETLLDTFQSLLELEGYHVVATKNGKEALAALETAKRPCLILLDMFMPIMDGWEFLEQLKLKDADLITSLPIVIASAAGEKAESAAKQVRGFIKKPFDLDALLKIVMTFCKKPKKDTNTLLN